jgi:hypothetical protein
MLLGSTSPVALPKQPDFCGLVLLEARLPEPIVRVCHAPSLVSSRLSGAVADAKMGRQCRSL